MPNQAYLNPLSDSRISPPFYILYILLSYLSFASWHSFFLHLYLSGWKVPMVRMGGVTTMGVGWSSEETSGLVVPPLNLVLYMHLRIFAYTSNTSIVSFEYMDCTLASVTLRSCLFTDRAPVMKLICSTRTFLSLLLPLLVPLGFFWLLPAWGDDPSHDLLHRSIWYPVWGSGTVDPRFRMVCHSILSGGISIPKCTRTSILEPLA